MGEYNYSPFFLKAHHETVRQLIEAAKTAGLLEAHFETPAEARAFRNLVLNLKRSLALNEPEFAFVHNTLRTSTSRDEVGTWIVQVGHESRLAKSGKKLRGARFSMVGASEGHILRMDGIPDQKALFRLIELTLGKAQTEAIILTPQPPQALEYLDSYVNQATGLGFEILASSPHLHLRLIKKAEPQPASAMLASDSQ
jgi:hypothetical protein